MVRAENEIANQAKVCEDRLEDQKRKHALELKQLRERLLIEQDELKSDMLKRA